MVHQWDLEPLQQRPKPHVVGGVDAAAPRPAVDDFAQRSAADRHSAACARAKVASVTKELVRKQTLGEINVWEATAPQRADEKCVFVIREGARRTPPQSMLPYEREKKAYPG